MQTRDQQYARSAFGKVREFERECQAADGRGDTLKKTYGALAHKLPVLIYTSGLAQALAFVEARGNSNGQKRLLTDLTQTLSEVAALPGEPDADLADRARTVDAREYMYLTRQVLAALLWYKRYAQSILDVEQGETVDDAGESDNG